MPRQPVCWVLECAGCSSVLGAFVVRQNAGCIRMQPEERICVVPGGEAEFESSPRLGAPASGSFRFRRGTHDVRPYVPLRKFPTSDQPCPTRCILHFVLRAGAVFRLRFGLRGAAPLVRAPAGAHRDGAPRGGFLVRAGTIAHQQRIVVLAGKGSVVRPRGSNDERVRDGWEPVKLQAGTRYTVLGTGYTVLGTPYAVLERQTGNRRRRVARDKTVSSRHTDHRFPPRNGPDTTNVYTTTYDVSPSLLDQPRRHRTGRFLLLGFQCSPVRHPDAKPCGNGKKCRPCSRMRCVPARLGRRFPTRHDIVNADPRELRPAPGELQPRAPAYTTMGKE